MYQTLETRQQLEAIRRAALRIDEMWRSVDYLVSHEARADVSYEEYRELVAQEREGRRRRFMEAE